MRQLLDLIVSITDREQSFKIQSQLRRRFLPGPNIMMDGWGDLCPRMGGISSVINPHMMVFIFNTARPPLAVLHRQPRVWPFHSGIQQSDYPSKLSGKENCSQALMLVTGRNDRDRDQPYALVEANQGLLRPLPRIISWKGAFIPDPIPSVM